MLRVSDPSYPSETFHVAPAACGDGKLETSGCPFELSYTGVQGAARSALMWGVARAPVTVGASGIGEIPSHTNTPIPAKALFTGAQATAVQTTLRPVALAPGVSGVLVDQRSGAEPAKSAHYLLVAREKKLERLWTYEDGAGPAAGGGSNTSVVNLDPERAAVVLVTDDRMAEDSRDADRARVTLVRWDDHEGKVVEEESLTVRAVLVGGYSSVWAAKDARKRSGQCLRAFAVLRASEFVYTASREPFVLGIVTADEATAAELLDTAQHCGTHVKGAVVTLRPRAKP